jgi:DNA-directed RNA polymerase subunit omega
MARVTVEDCLDKVPNRFSLVMLVAKRAKQLMKGETPLVASKENKCVVTALREVAADRVSFNYTSEEEFLLSVQEDLSRNVPADGSMNSFDTGGADVSTDSE